jgi:hypothetical protein
MTGGLVDALIDDSREHRLLGQSAAYRDASFDAAGAAAAAGQVRARPDASSYLLLMALRRAAPEAYASIPVSDRAAVLVDALRTQRNLNDWGYIEDSGSYDGPAARALLELGDAAAEPLRGLLGDDRPAPLMGSEPGALADAYRYRRRDWAYHYLARLLGREPAFPRDPVERDREIEALAGPAR